MSSLSGSPLLFRSDRAASVKTIWDGDPFSTQKRLERLLKGLAVRPRAENGPPPTTDLPRIRRGWGFRPGPQGNQPHQEMVTRYALGHRHNSGSVSTRGGDGHGHKSKECRHENRADENVAQSGHLSLGSIKADRELIERPSRPTVPDILRDLRTTSTRESACDASPVCAIVSTLAAYRQTYETCHAWHKALDRH